MGILSTLAYHNDPEIKTKYVDRVKAHKAADEIIQGTYWRNGKGCAVGCTVEQHESPHQAMETELGVPRSLAYLEDHIFEGLTNSEAKDFPLAFLQAISPGADLSQVVPKFLLWLLSDPVDGVIKFAKTDVVRNAIQAVIALYTRKLAGEVITDEEWRQARKATAAAAYADAATATAYAAAATATATATYAADAADAATATAYAARHKHYKKMATKLLELLRST